jgi:hypothetical protein
LRGSSLSIAKVKSFSTNDIKVDGNIDAYYLPPSSKDSSRGSEKIGLTKSSISLFFQPFKYVLLE